MHDFFYMDGYAPYIWSAYGITLVIIIWMIVGSLLARRKTRREEQKITDAA